jgi:hypothetical protein
MGWSKSLGSDYSPFLFGYMVLPQNKILTYGFGGGPYGGTGTATLDDTTFTFGNKTEMLLGLMDTTGHYETAINERVHDTRFIGASYDLSGNAYILSKWDLDTTYTMGSSIQTTSGDLVISKLAYMSISAGIDNKDSNKELSIYPNPSKGRFNIKLNSSLQKTTICIYDILGNCILSQASESEINKIDLNGQAKGIYFVQIDNGKEKINKKIVIN